MRWCAVEQQFVEGARLEDEIIIITAYEPDPALWEADFKRKRP
ncbi:hypothetical protein [Candidatus Chloroploca sp. Khr17]|nr:hypothetical protein [Candidatus Chloroploca sp. Khr17]